MTENHPSPEALERFVLRQLSTAEMREIARHLLSGCQQCQLATGSLWEPSAEDEELPALALVEEGGGDSARDGYDEVLDRVFHKVMIEEAVVAEQRLAGRKLFEELMQVPAERRHLLVSNSNRFRHRMLSEQMIEESQAAGFDKPSRAVELARLATLAADRLRPEDCGSEESRNGLRARAWAQLGNALRISSDLAGAERAFGVAESLLDGGCVSLLDRAHVLGLLITLRVQQRRSAEALQICDRAAVIYKKLGQWSLLGRTLVQKSVVCGEAGDTESEMRLLRRALDLIDPQTDPRVFLVARHNLIYALNDSGRSREAFALLFHSRPLYLKAGGRMDLLRLRWLEGLVALGLLRTEQAEVAFREVREAFGELGLGYDAALASLDLATVYVLQGRAAEVRQLSEETLTLSKAYGLHEEALAALLALCNAARLDQAGLELVREISGFLRRFQHDPDLRFSPAS